MIKKSITGFTSEELPYMMANLAQGFTVEQPSATTVIATGPSEYWALVSLPTGVTLTVVE